MLRFLCTATIGLLMLASPIGASADTEFPDRSIKVLVPYPAGGLPDVVARVVGERMRVVLKQPIVVENRPGAGGGIAAAALITQPADGYTLMLTEGSILYNSLIIKSLSYDARDLRPVAQVARAPQFLAVNTKLPIATVSDLITYAKQNPGKINYGSAGVGSPHHLAMEWVKSGLKLDLVHVPFKGSNEAVPALIRGEIDIMWSAYPAIATAIGEKRVNLLATNAPSPSKQAPEVPPMARFIPNFDTASMVGIFAKVGTPEAIVKKLAEAAVSAAEDPAVKERLSATGVDGQGLSADAYAAALKSEFERVQKIVAEANISQD